MPEKQTRESIEADFNASEIDRAVAKLQEAKRAMEEFERRLQDEEREWEITSIPSKPLVERMAAIGMSKEVIDYVSDMLGAVTKIGLGRMDEIPHRIRRDLTETPDAEVSALDQLQNILDARRRRSTGRIQKRKSNHLQIVIFGLQRAAGPYRRASNGNRDLRNFRRMQECAAG